MLHPDLGNLIFAYYLGVQRAFRREAFDSRIQSRTSEMQRNVIARWLWL